MTLQHVGFVVLTLSLWCQTAVDAFASYPSNILCSGSSVPKLSSPFRPPSDASSRSTTTLRLAEDNRDVRSEPQQGDDNDEPAISRRDALSMGVTTTAASLLGTSAQPQQAWADDDFRPSIRATAYRVDSTIPPTLIPLNARKETSILKGLGRGSGTSKDAIFVDTINLNNLMNKAVFGTINAVNNLVSPKTEDDKSGPGYASFVCLGLPRETSDADVDLSVSLLTEMIQPRKSAETALGLSYAPLSTQPALDAYLQNGDEKALLEAMTNAGVSESVFQMHLPLFRFAREPWQRSMSLLAMAPEVNDVETVRSKGLQNIDPNRRSEYVLDSEGFIALTQDPKFRLYTDRSLFKDYVPLSKSDQEGNFFAERILTHEAGASAVARFAATRPDSFVAIVAPIQDVRYMGGINGRIPRICKFLNKESKVNNDAVTTILVNPTAKETLSRTRFLRLEIGTAPENLQYQTKIADYLWFSTMPKVNMIPRMMNP